MHFGRRFTLLGSPRPGLSSTYRSAIRSHVAFVCQAYKNLSKELRALVLDRNGFTCQMCGAVAGEPHPYEPNRKTRLHLGHIVDKSQGGEDIASNLRALCSVCNEGASNLTLDRPSLSKLLIQVRRARRDDQLEVLDWLKKKFGT